MSDSDSGRESPVANYRPRAAYHHPKLIDNDRNTKLHYAAAKNDVDSIVQYLEKESHVVDPQNYLGWTPLMMACRKGHFEAVKRLLTYRANATKKNKLELNVFQIAVTSGHLEMVQYLLEHLLVGGVSKSVLEQTLSVASLAILFKHESVLEFLITKDFNINKGTPEQGITPFMFAHAMENNQAILTLLKNKVDSKIKNCLGHTAVDIATIRYQIKVVPVNDHANHTRKLASQESIQNEIQNQRLRHALQLNTESSTPAHLYSPQPQGPYIIVSPYAHNAQIKLLTVPSQIIPQHTRKSSNLSPFPVPPPPPVTPISPAFRPQMFFPPEFSPSHYSPFNMMSQECSSLAAQTYDASELLNVKFNSSAGMFFSPSVMNFLSPYM